MSYETCALPSDVPGFVASDDAPRVSCPDCGEWLTADACENCAENAPELISQAAWCKRLGVSRKTFWQWRGLGLIPVPLDLPGRPRWKARVVEQVTATLGVTKRGLFQRRGGERSLQSQSSRFQQRKGSAHSSFVASESSGDVHARHLGKGESGVPSNSVVGGAR